MRVFYLNGDYVPEESALVSVMDRGFLMADAVYEVVAVLNGKLTDFEGHFERLGRSTAELGLPMPFSRESLIGVLREMCARNGLEEGLIYLQVTRGVAERDFLMPKNIAPTVVMFTQVKPLLDNALAKRGAKVITRPDLRWGRGDIKTTQLLYASLMKTEAAEHGADDCWLERDGIITEGTSNNVYIRTGNTIHTPPKSRKILAGITRQSLLELCALHGYEFQEREFAVSVAENADEAFFTSAGALVMPVVKINDCEISEGQVGKFTQALRDIYIKNAIAHGI